MNMTDIDAWVRQEREASIARINIHIENARQSKDYDGANALETILNWLIRQQLECSTSPRRYSSCGNRAAK